MDSIRDYVNSLPIVSTHEHHLSLADAAKIATLDGVFERSYTRLCGGDLAQREAFLDLVGANSYFRWHEKALDSLFHFGGEITESNWDSISDQIAAAFPDPTWHKDVLRSKCRYERAITDTYWDPGSDLDRPDLYAPAFRINSFLYGNSVDSADHNGNNAQKLYGECESLDEYLGMIDRVIAERKAAGCVCLKSALAYDRALDFKPRSKRAAERVFGKHKSNVAPDELKAFGDFVFDHICTLAARHDLPIQNHTGLGRLDGSNPVNLIPMIEAHPDTKFVLFHGGYPWIEETCALSHNYDNVYVDLCWLPVICTSACERFLRCLIEAAKDSARITWGGDSWLVTESYAGSLAIRNVVANVLSERIADGYLPEHRAKRLAERILNENARELYKLE